MERNVYICLSAKNDSDILLSEICRDFRRIPVQWLVSQRSFGVPRRQHDDVNDETQPRNEPAPQRPSNSNDIM